MLAYYQNINDSTYLSTYDINQNEDLHIKESEQNIYLTQNSKKLIYTIFYKFIEIISYKNKLNIIDVDLNLQKSIVFENTPICLDIFQSTLTILFYRGNSNYYINIFNCIYNSDEFHINLINEINVGILNYVANYILIINENKILYSKISTQNSHNLFLFNYLTNEEYNLGPLSNYSYDTLMGSTYGSAFWIDNYILYNNSSNKKIYIYNSDNKSKIYEFESKYRIFDILSTLTKIMVISSYDSIIEIYDKNFPHISLLGEIDIKFLIN